MTAIHDQRAIIDRRRFSADLAALPPRRGGAADVEADAALQALLRQYLTAGRAEVRRRFEAHPRAAGSGRQASRETSFLMDQIVRGLYDFALVHIAPGLDALACPALVAVGGYGRGELAPYSDIDLLFLLPQRASPAAKRLVEFMLYRLWDLGLKVGQATRTVRECLEEAENDLSVRTSLLEARYIWGEQTHYKTFRRSFWQRIVKGRAEAFYHDKLAERAARHQRIGNFRYTLEPNLKDGKGGLRDLQTLRWVARFIDDRGRPTAIADLGLLQAGEAAAFEKAENFFWTLRCHLHYMTGRAEERLTFDVQPELARRLGYSERVGANGAERLMKHYFIVAKSVGRLTRYFCAAVEEGPLKKSRFTLRAIGFGRKEIEGFMLEGGRLSVVGPGHFKDHPVDILRIFRTAQRHGIDIHPSAMSWLAQATKGIGGALRRMPEANAVFLDILTAPQGPEIALRRMNETGVFGRFIPDFGRVVAQMQFDMYHHYTVDEHTIFALGILHRIESGALREEAPVASAVVHQILSRRVLYLAVLLHDIAKGRGGDHSILGAEAAVRLCPRLGLSAEETETVAWLVRHHLLMSNTAFRRDIDDPKTIADFTDIVQSMERLRLLLILTVADIRAVGPKTWNGWKAALLRGLYDRAADLISGGLAAVGEEARVAAALKAVRAALPDWSTAAWEAHVARGHAAYWLAFPAETLAHQARLIRDAEEEGRVLAIDKRIDSWRAMTEVTIYAADRKGLVAQLTGACALAGANIVDARIITLKNGYALDTFTIQDSEGGAFDRPQRLARLEAMIARVLDAPERTLAELKDQPQLANPTAGNFPVAPRILIDNKASATHSVIEINCRDRRGLVHRLTAALTAQNLQISSAKISTFGHRAIDTFYVKDQFGLKVENESRLAGVRAALMAIIAEPAAPSRVA